MGLDAAPVAQVRMISRETLEGFDFQDPESCRQRELRVGCCSKWERAPPLRFNVNSPRISGAEPAPPSQLRSMRQLHTNAVAKVAFVQGHGRTAIGSVGKAHIVEPLAQVVAIIA